MKPSASHAFALSLAENAPRRCTSTPYHGRNITTSRTIPLAAAIWSPRPSFEVSTESLLGFAVGFDAGAQPIQAPLDRRSSGARRTPAAPPGRLVRRTGARRGGSRGPSPPRAACRSARSASPWSPPPRRGSCARRPRSSARCARRARRGRAVRWRTHARAPTPRRAAGQTAAARARRSRRAPRAAAVSGVAGHQPDPHLRRISRTRFVQRRRSQLAANSSAPPTQTPSTAAITGTGAASTTRVRRWKPPIVASQAAASASSADWRSSPAEKWSPAPRSTIERTSAPRRRPRSRRRSRSSCRRPRRCGAPGGPRRSPVPCPARRSRR